MSSGDSAGDFKEVTWPPIGFIYDQEFMLPAFCKPKLCPLKSITLEKLEKMQQESLERLKQIEEQQMQQAAESAAAATKVCGNLIVHILFFKSILHCFEI